MEEKQELFNKVVAGFEAQGWKPGYDEEIGKCRYRTEDGLKCAVGLLLTDEEYAMGVEGSSAYSVGDRFGWNDEKTDFLANLQTAHDVAADAGCDLKVALQRFALEHKLTFPSTETV